MYEYGCTVTGVKEDKNGPEMIVTYQDREKIEQTARASRVFAPIGLHRLFVGYYFHKSSEVMPDMYDDSTISYCRRLRSEEPFLNLEFLNPGEKH